eukprot:scaffold7029_cov100-Cylindrotheca_fusiformis.AAC.1
MPSWMAIVPLAYVYPLCDNSSNLKRETLLFRIGVRPVFVAQHIGSRYAKYSLLAKTCGGNVK